MRELRQALSDISAIRSQVAQATQFQGYGPRSTAVTGVLALAVALGQSLWMPAAPADATAFVLVWVLTAAISAALTTCETIFRTQRLHDGFVREMIQAAVEQFLPAVVAGLLLTAVLIQAAPQEAWMLPGLWQIAFSLGIFASRRFLPRPLFGVGLWYLTTGLACLTALAATHELSPWAMGLPFGIGQLYLAAVLKHGYENPREERRS